MGPGGRARSIGNRMTSLIAARDPVRRGPPRAPLLLLLAVPRLRHHGLRFDPPHRDCRDRLSGQRPILLLVEHGHRPLRAFTIHETVHDDLGVAADDFPPKAAGSTVAYE